MSTDVNTTKLKINILDKDSYDDLSTISNSELYIVKENANDTDNSVASRTYADVGRDVVVSQASEPTSPNTKIWIDTDEEVVYITPASNDLDNLTTTGKNNLVSSLTPDYSSAITYSTTYGNTFTTLSAGWLYVFVDNDSEIVLKKDNITGINLTNIVTTSTKSVDKILVEKNTTIYVNTRTGTVDLVFYPCKGVV